MAESALPQRLDAFLIESELKTLWRQIAQETEKNEEEVLRARVVNLVVCSNLDEEVDQLALDLTSGGDSQSGRLILLLTDEESSSDGFDSRVSAHCSRQPGGREQICGEIIRIVAHGKAAGRSASVVTPLLIHDLPVFLWWRRSVDLDSALLRRLARITDRLIVDSARAGVDDVLALSKLTALWKDVTISDLAWARLQVWRRALAGLYDSGLTREVLGPPDSGWSSEREGIYPMNWSTCCPGWPVDWAGGFGLPLSRQTLDTDWTVIPPGRIWRSNFIAGRARGFAGFSFPPAVTWLCSWHAAIRTEPFWKPGQSGAAAGSATRSFQGLRRKRSICWRPKSRSRGRIKCSGKLSPSPPGFFRMSR